MDLGALICTPDPECLICPLVACCEARRLGLQDALPVLSPKPPPLSVVEAVPWWFATDRCWSFSERRRPLVEVLGVSDHQPRRRRPRRAIVRQTCRPGRRNRAADGHPGPGGAGGPDADLLGHKASGRACGSTWRKRSPATEARPGASDARFTAPRHWLSLPWARPHGGWRPGSATRESARGKVSQLRSRYRPRRMTRPGRSRIFGLFKAEPAVEGAGSSLITRTGSAAAAERPCLESSRALE